MFKQKWIDLYLVTVVPNNCGFLCVNRSEKFAECPRNILLSKVAPAVQSVSSKGSLIQSPGSTDTGTRAHTDTCTLYRYQGTQIQVLGSADAGPRRTYRVQTLWFGTQLWCVLKRDIQCCGYKVPQIKCTLAPIPTDTSALRPVIAAYITAGTRDQRYRVLFL